MWQVSRGVVLLLLFFGAFALSETSDTSASDKEPGTTQHLRGTSASAQIRAAQISGEVSRAIRLSTLTSFPIKAVTVRGSRPAFPPYICLKPEILVVI